MQVLNEQHKLNRVIETSGPPELAEAQKEIDKLQNELKMRTKLNELQSAKVSIIPASSLVPRPPKSLGTRIVLQ